MKSIKIYSIAFAAMLSFTSSFSFVSAKDTAETQSAITITGTVTNKNGDAIKGAPIEVLNTGEYTLTDKNGSYKIEGLPDSKLRFSYIGYESDTITVNKTTNINVRLYPEGDAQKTKSTRGFKDNWIIGAGVGGTISL